MRKGLTLIELILSMVIIGIVFTVIPRLILSMNQSAQVTVKEEAMFNALAMIGAIINLPWDNNNTLSNQILNVTDGNASYECNASTSGGGELGYRIGGFIGSRNCRALADGTYDFNASTALGQEDSHYNDIDDFDGNLTTTKSCANLYDLNTTVKYVDDDDYSPIAAGKTSNAKMIGVKVKYTSTNKFAGTAGCIADLNYTAYNIGHIHINSRNW